MNPDIVVMRHPRPLVAEGRCYGQLDIPLAPDWEASLEAHLPLLQQCRAIISSPLHRCRRPAEWLSERLDLALTLDPGLMELNFGRWEGQSWQAIDGPEARAWGDDFINRAPPGGESFRALARRVRQSFTAYRDRVGPLLIISHGGPIRVLKADAKGADLTTAFEEPLNFAEPQRLSDSRLFWRQP
ncbi:alpha-ribazole phosphatase [Natronospira proteinivora]|uniref:Alpha-ribazole phosphatase n=1 Tax=Natronospira proteinivora TaxID=1807133 RepID=A0ABT1GA73_9GAMM|nr:alpha-ribazole phosphatase family protein [Natronospira proteinivora]MCP1726832.1 alpha-ribazole phosphatase [Natronospira proteinivora]